ncbi:MAG: DEAD/DEAH box helicase [Candidatus Helarchaeota archaeon]|nr:DEAD/DEAH box helicase [Candidatus Helarchaeota archaeon]
MDFDSLLNSIEASEVREIVHIKKETGRSPDYSCSIEALNLHPDLTKALKKIGIESLYSFQERAIKKIRSGKNVGILAGTGSGKTEAFLIPILEYALNHPNQPIAILMYPTKALAQDQMDRLEGLTRNLNIKFERYDGDTPLNKREEILNNPPSILITNPDMLHFHLSDDRVKKIISTIKFIVLDEIHQYVGVFGSHVHYVLKRVKRFLQDSKKCQFIGSSATIGNPRKFLEIFFGVKFSIITSKHNWSGNRHHLMIRPKHSLYSEAIFLIEGIQEQIPSVKSIIFTDSHLSAEIVKKIADSRNIEIGIHRGGLSSAYRKEIEARFKSGKLTTLVATPTLELGIDIGDLNNIVLIKIPVTFSTYLQRIGRSGRKGVDSMAFLLIGEDPISNFYANAPKNFYSSKPEPLYLDPTNPEIIRAQFIAMAVDQPISPLELVDLTPEERTAAQQLLNEKYLAHWEQLYLIPTKKGNELFRNTSLRGTGETIQIFEREKKIGERSLPMGIRELYPNAIYMHGGKDYRVINLDLQQYQAQIEEILDRTNFYTRALYQSEVINFNPRRSRHPFGLNVYHGEGAIHTNVYGFLKINFFTGKPIEKENLEIPVDYQFPTKILYFKIPVDPSWTLSQKAEATHAVEHVLIAAAVTLTGADASEIGGISYPDGTIFVYDGIFGGSGITLLLQDRIKEALKRALKILKLCNCRSYTGCPRCTYSPYCGNNNETLSRNLAIQSLTQVLAGKDVKVDFKPSGNSIV